MPEPTPPTDPEKNRRSRSFGSFLVVLLVLLLVLMIVGGDRFQPAERLSQDQYEWNLHNGTIVSQRFKGTEAGTNQIQGMFRKTGEGEVPFEVSYASLENREARFRELKARQYEQISPEALLRGVERNEYQPLEIRSLTAFEEEAAAGATTGSDGSPPEPPRISRDEKLLVSVLAGAGRDGGQRSGRIYFDVDLDACRRESWSVIIDTHEFDP